MAPKVEVAQKALTKSEKAAVLLLCMDEKSTGELFAQMEDDEIRKIGTALLRLNQIPAVQIQEVIDEFAKSVVGIKVSEMTAAAAPVSNDIALDGPSVAERLLGRSLSRGRSRQIMTSLSSPSKPQAAADGTLEDILLPLSSDEIFKIAGAEHPQVLALVLSLVKRKTAKAVLAQLEDAMQVDVIGRIARLAKVPMRVTQEIGAYIRDRVNERAALAASGVVVDEVVEEAAVVVEETEIDGFENTLRLLKSMPRERANQMIEAIGKFDAETCAQLNKRMFTIEDLERSDDPGIRELLRGISNDELKIALKDAPDTVKEIFFKNMSERASLILREDMGVLPPQKVEDIERAQDSIVAVAKKLIGEDKMHLAAVAEDDE